MKINFFLLAFLTMVFITSSDPFFGNDLGHVRLPTERSGDVKELRWMSTEAFAKYLNDYENKVSDLFPVTDYYYPTVHFWFLIYTQFESSQVVIHDKTNLNLIYKVLDFTSLHKKKLPRNTLYVLQQKISDEKVSAINQTLTHLATNPYSLEPGSKNIYGILKEAKIALPISRQERSNFFLKLKDNLRTQTGQKNFIREGIIRSIPYKPFIHDYFKQRSLPFELLAIPFLESSFNPRAQSRVSALGVWQFMPLISSYYVPKRTDQFDYRSNVGVASVAAAFLMAENFKIMKSWDLAVTAYNSGTKHLLKSKREFASQKISLEDIIKHSTSQSFGFASKNFYGEFLALVHALAYEDEVFGGIHKNEREDVSEPLIFYQSKCAFRLDSILNDTQLENIQFYNDQLNSLKQTVPRGSIFTAKMPLPHSKFNLVKMDQILKTKPKDWIKFLGNQSCSTR